MVSTGCLSIVLFADRTLLLRYDASTMSAAMTGGNLFWSMLCLPLGIASMTGAFVSQYVGVGRPERIGRLLWQAIFLALMTIPVWIMVAWNVEPFLRWTGQPESLLELESLYLRTLAWGAPAAIIEAALSGFFSGTHRTTVVMWTNISSATLNLLLNVPFIFGWGIIPEMGIFGAGLATVISFWFKAAVYAILLSKRNIRMPFGFVDGMTWDASLFRRLLFYGLPAGFQSLIEAGAFTAIVLQIGQLGDAPLQATTMAINFNMIAFVPLIGISIASSVLVGQHLTQSGAAIAKRAVFTSVSIGLAYSAAWGLLYLLTPDLLISLYETTSQTEAIDGSVTQPVNTAAAIEMAKTLLRFVAAYVLFDSIQLVLAGALRGAGDTWFVLSATATASLCALAFGWLFEPDPGSAYYWWAVMTIWIWLLAGLMTLRFARGRWQEKRLVSPSLNSPESP